MVDDTDVCHYNVNFEYRKANNRKVLVFPSLLNDMNYEQGVISFDS